MSFFSMSLTTANKIQHINYIGVIAFAYFIWDFKINQAMTISPYLLFGLAAMKNVMDIQCQLSNTITKAHYIAYELWLCFVKTFLLNLCYSGNFIPKPLYFFNTVAIFAGLVIASFCIKNEILCAIKKNHIFRMLILLAIYTAKIRPVNTLFQKILKVTNDNQENNKTILFSFAFLLIMIFNGVYKNGSIVIHDLLYFKNLKKTKLPYFVLIVEAIFFTLLAVFSLIFLGAMKSEMLDFFSLKEQLALFSFFNFTFGVIVSGYLSIQVEKMMAQVPNSNLGEKTKVQEDVVVKNKLTEKQKMQELHSDNESTDASSLNSPNYNDQNAFPNLVENNKVQDDVVVKNKLTEKQEMQELHSENESPDASFLNFPIDNHNQNAFPPTDSTDNSDSKKKECEENLCKRKVSGV